jgi:Glycosyl hydrolase family 71
MVGNTYVTASLLPPLHMTSTKIGCHSPTPLMIGSLILGWHKYMVCEFAISDATAVGPKYHPTYNSDAFALNVGREDWQRARVADAYAAALQLQTNFKLFLSFDMT